MSCIDNCININPQERGRIFKPLVPTPLDSIQSKCSKNINHKIDLENLNLEMKQTISTKQYSKYYNYFAEMTSDPQERIDNALIKTSPEMKIYMDQAVEDATDGLISAAQYQRKVYIYVALVTGFNEYVEEVEAKFIDGDSNIINESYLLQYNSEVEVQLMQEGTRNYQPMKMPTPNVLLGFMTPAQRYYRQWDSPSCADVLKLTFKQQPTPPLILANIPNDNQSVFKQEQVNHNPNGENQVLMSVNEINNEIIKVKVGDNYPEINLVQNNPVNDIVEVTQTQVNSYVVANINQDDLNNNEINLQPVSDLDQIIETEIIQAIENLPVTEISSALQDMQKFISNRETNGQVDDQKKPEVCYFGSPQHVPCYQNHRANTSDEEVLKQEKVNDKGDNKSDEQVSQETSPLRNQNEAEGEIARVALMQVKSQEDLQSNLVAQANADHAPMVDMETIYTDMAISISRRQGQSLNATPQKPTKRPRANKATANINEEHKNVNGNVLAQGDENDSSQFKFLDTQTSSDSQSDLKKKRKRPASNIKKDLGINKQGKNSYKRRNAQSSSVSTMESTPQRVQQMSISQQQIDTQQQQLAQQQRITLQMQQTQQQRQQLVLEDALSNYCQYLQINRQGWTNADLLVLFKNQINYNYADNKHLPENQRYASRVITPLSCHYEKAPKIQPLPIDKLFIVFKDSASNLETNKRLFKLMIGDPEMTPIHKDVITSFVNRNTPFHFWTTTPVIVRSRPAVTLTEPGSLFDCGECIKYTARKIAALHQSDYYNNCRLAHNAVNDALARLGPQPQFPVIQYTLNVVGAPIVANDNSSETDNDEDGNDPSSEEE